MSRIGRNPIPVPKGVTVTIDGNHVDVKGKLGELSNDFPEGISIALEDDNVVVSRSEDTKTLRSFHGLTRALLANMVTGVQSGFSKDMEIVGVGYRIEPRGSAVSLAIGFSHRVIFIAPEGVSIKINSPTTFTVSGIDKQLVGETAAKIRSIRPPEPYKGKGIKYAGEYIRRKAGKAAVK